MNYSLPGNRISVEPEFNYSVWTANTEIMLCSVPWNADYRDVVKFDSRQDRDNYLRSRSGKVYPITDSVYARFGEPIDLGIPFNVANEYNYLRVYNPTQPINGDYGKAYYYFITGVEHVNTNDTRIYVQLDIWQTFGDDIQFGNCFIERGHIGIANENGFNNYGRDYLTVPEGLDIGGEYQISRIVSRKIGTSRSDVPQFAILVTSTIDLTGDVGTYLDPKMSMADGNLSENLPNGAETYHFGNLTNFKTFLGMFKDKPHALQGIVSIIAIPPTYVPPGDFVDPAKFPGMKRLTAGALDNVQHKLMDNWRTMLNKTGRYRHLHKFKVYPYTVLELTSYTGTPLMLKPESWQDEDATVNEIPHFASQSARVMFSPNNYNASSGAGPGTSDSHGMLRDSGEFLDMATGIFNFPSFSVVNDGFMMYLANNKNNLAFSHSSADWGQQRALGGNQLSYDQASAGMATAAEANRLGVNASIASNAVQDTTAIQSTALNAVNSVGRGMAGGAAGIAGGLASAATAGLSTAIDINSRNQHLGISAGLANAQTANSLGNAAYMRDSNKSFADYASRGDYQNTIAGINAKVQDARMIQPTTAGQVGGESFALARYQWGYDLKVKTMDPSATAMVGEYWLRYGYQVNRFGRMPVSLKVMSKFTYWKLRETYLVSAKCPETFKQAIRGIFEKGVTVWNDPNDIGNIDNAANDPLPGVTL